MILTTALLVGALTLQPCDDAAGYWCGELTRALDPAGRVPGTIAIGFRWLPHSDARHATKGTIVAAEGGPGYPSGGSRDSYRALFGPLLNDRDLLLMDNRGTGRSSAIDCPDLQRGALTMSAIARCAAQLGPRSDLYGTGLAADDLDALLGALSVNAVDLYGDSYGTFFAQVFAARHPSRVRTLTLDAAFPAIGEDPWYPTAASTVAAAFDHVCRRAASCAALPGSTQDRIEHLLAALRAHVGPVTPPQLAFVMDSAGLDPLVYRDLDASARAYLAGDFVPLQRLVREAQQYEEQPPADARVLSNGLFLAVSCSDYPQAYDMGLPPAQREKNWHHALAAKQRDDPHLYAPFTIDEYLRIPLDYAYVPVCRNWPVAAAEHPAGSDVPAGVRMPDVPALVLTGDLDTITTPAEGDATAAQFPRARRTIVLNTGHVSAIDDVYHCASALVRAFIAAQPLDAECAARIPPIRLVPAFARDSSEIAPASAAGTNEDAQVLRLAADAALAADDALARFVALGVSQGSGLRGGTFAENTHDEFAQLTLRGVEWTQDLAVWGRVDFDSRTGSSDAHLFWPRAELHATWNAYDPGVPTELSGTIDGSMVRATLSY